MKEVLNRELFAMSISDTKDFRHMSLADIKAQTGLSRATISRCCNGTYLPDVETYATICKWLNVPLDYFFFNPANR